MTTAHDQRLRALLDAARSQGLERQLPAIRDRHGLSYRLRGQQVISFCSNDYLGYASELPADTPPTRSGSSGSRLVTGDAPEHRDAEARLAKLAQADGAVLFPSGFQLNVGALPSLLHASDIAHSDRLNHASLVDGLRLSPCPRTLLDHLEPPTVGPPDEGFAWWITESIFSMDGDGPALEDMLRHLQSGGCLYLDEAHAFGLHTAGQGRAAALAVPPTAIVAPLGKAFGYAGAFIAGSHTLCEWIRTRARSFVFTTGIAPIAARHILQRAEQLAGPDGDIRRERLWANVHRFASHFPARATTIPSPIFPFCVTDNHRALALSAALLERGWHVQAIRPPTVPPGTARLRVSLSAAHTLEQIDELADDLNRLLSTIELQPTATTGSAT